jgi:CubicO group peptidase (beta-lactamase class C family)
LILEKPKKGRRRFAVPCGSISRVCSLVLSMSVLASLPLLGQGQASALGAIQGFFKALNAEDLEEMFLFYEDGVTEGFRSKQTPAEDRAMYERIRADLGPIEVRGIRRISPSQAEASVFSAKSSRSVRFLFDIENGRIAGFSIRPDEAQGGGFTLATGLDQEALTRAIDKELRQRAQADTFSGVVLLAKGGTPIFEEAYGLANRDTGIPITLDTRFDIGSITKMFTKVAVAQLVAAGKLGLVDTVLQHIPDYPDHEIAKRVTVQHLVDHSSGLGDIFNDRWEATPKEKLLTPRDFFPLFQGVALEFEPGQGERYSNAGYIVLGAIIEAVSGLDYASYVQQRVFEPAGMTRSGFPIRADQQADLAIGYTTGEMEGEEPGVLRSNLGSMPGRGCPAGSSTHTAADLLKFDRALREHRLLPPEWTAWVLTGSFGDAANKQTAATAIGIGGGGPGVSASLISDEDTATIVLSNRDPSATQGLAQQLAAAFEK